MNARLTLSKLLLPSITLVLFSHLCVAQERTVPQGGCVALDKKSPPLFVSYERRDDHARNGHNYVPGVLLRLNNNSNCVLSLTVPPGYAREVPPIFGFKNGKRVRLPDVRIGSIKSGTNVELYYLTKYPGDESLYLDADFHVRDTIYLNGGDFIFFSVPLKNFKRNGRVLVPFTYDWDSDKGTYVPDTRGVLVGAVEHYLVFQPTRLPPEILK
jgi:hypothetical protein